MNDAVLVFPPACGGQVAGQDGCQLPDEPQTVGSARVSPVLVVQGWQGAGSVTGPVGMASSRVLEAWGGMRKNPQDSQVSTSSVLIRVNELTLLVL